MNNLIKINQLTKAIILRELTKIRIDHSIEINTENFKEKINLLFDDCTKRGVSEQYFINKCEQIRCSNLFGKMPENFRFYENFIKITNEFALSANQILGADLIISGKDNGYNEWVVVVNSREDEKALLALSEEKRAQIKALVPNEIKKFIFEVKNG